MECKKCGSKNIQLLETSAPRHTKLKWELLGGIVLSFCLSAIGTFFIWISTCLIIALLVVMGIDKKNRYVTKTKYVCLDCNFEEYI